MDPWETVIENWVRTEPLRRIDLNAKKKNLVNAFVNEWPILRHPDACLLIEKDFCSINLTDINLDPVRWENFFNDLSELYPINTRNETALLLSTLLDEQASIKVISFTHLKKTILQNSKNRNSNNCFSNYCFTDSKVAVQLLFLPHMIPPVKKVSRKWKPSIPECTDSLIINIKVKSVSSFPLLP